MDRSLYIAASVGQVGVLRQHIDQLEIQTTANRNTALHVAAQFGQLECVATILEGCPSLLRGMNIRGETPLHMAAREGYADIVKALIEFAKKREQEVESGLGGEAKKMLRVTNVDKDTALHMAARNCHLEREKYLEVIKLLIEEDPEFKHPANNADETPLYLAAEQGSVDVVVILLETCISPTYGDPGGRTALHAAALNDLKGQSIKRLLEWKKDIIEEVYMYGWTSLHCAARNGNRVGVKQLLETSESLVYISTPNKDGFETALHIATAHGHIGVMEELLSQNPDCWGMVNNKGQNILHIAVEMEDKRAIKFIQGKPWLRHLINQKDNEVPELWKHSRADKNAFNNRNMTPMNLVWSTFEVEKMPTFAATYIDDSSLDSGISGGRSIAINSRDNRAKLKRAHRHEKEKTKMKKEAKQNLQKETVDGVLKIYQTLVVVAALIATITFAAAFAIPGGYNSNEGKDKGMAVLARAAAFKAFVITNTIAMVCSIASIFLCFTGMLYTSEEDGTVKDGTVPAMHRFAAAWILVLVAMFVMVLVFITAAFAVLASTLYSACRLQRLPCPLVLLLASL
ncbi:hypothetical protein Vadar_027008 [Vaccinium darrowii]|uniref:Uncharacterized protein n=1 Tax=Vaccinium darrowii TaxID=229202 RepID=A0ACB7XU95_9ERIC|nr:hypothetical protein Vadar_027008 [Vaccinium darrowii]